MSADPVTYSVWRLRLLRESSAHETRIDIVLQNATPDARRDPIVAVARFYERLHADQLGDWFDGDADEYQVIGAERIADEAYL